MKYQHSKSSKSNNFMDAFSLGNHNNLAIVLLVAILSCWVIQFGSGTGTKESNAANLTVADVDVPSRSRTDGMTRAFKPKPKPVAAHAVRQLQLPTIADSQSNANPNANIPYVDVPLPGKIKKRANGQMGNGTNTVNNECQFSTDSTTAAPLVVSIVARNIEYRADKFFLTLKLQDYDKKAICLVIQTSNNQDNTDTVVQQWVEKHRHEYASIVFRKAPSPELTEVTNAAIARTNGLWNMSAECPLQPHCWTGIRLLHVSSLRQYGLDLARKASAKYLFSLDSDVLLTDKKAISELVLQHKPIVAPLLYAYPNTWDANVWEKTHPHGGYVRGNYQLAFRAKKFTGCMQVKASHSAFLIDLAADGVEKLKLHDPSHQMSDINIMSATAGDAAVAMYGCNDRDYGYTMSVAGANTAYTHVGEALAFSHMLEKYKLMQGPQGPEDLRQRKSVTIAGVLTPSDKSPVPDILDSQAHPCECDVKETYQARHEAKTLRDQLDELRVVMFKQLEAVKDLEGAKPCAWDGDCSDDAFHVDHRHNLSLAEFHQKYSMKRRPVVITDYVNAGKLSTKGEMFNESYWKRMCGKKIVRIQKAAKAAHWGGLTYHSDRTLNDAFEVIRTTTDPLVYGVFDTPLPHACPEVLNEFVMPKYFANDYMQHVTHDMKLQYRDSWPSFFLGRANTTANLHVDMFGSSFWMAVFQGRKHWRFVDESQRGLLYENRATNDFPDIDLFNPDYEKYPLLRHVRTFDVILEAGDLLFVPGGSPHQVRNLDETITLAGNYIDEGSMETMREEVDHNSRRNYERYNQLMNSLLHPNFDLKMDLDLGDLTWAQLKSRATWKP